MSGHSIPHLTSRQFALFCAASALNTGFGYVAFAALKGIGFANVYAVAFSAVAGVVFNFGTFRAAFASSGTSRVRHFVAFYGLSIVVNIALLGSLTAAGLGPYLGEALTLLVTAPFAFLGMRYFVFPLSGAGEI